MKLFTGFPLNQERSFPKLLPQKNTSPAESQQQSQKETKPWAGSISFSRCPCHSCTDSFHLIHPQPPLDPPTLVMLTRTHIAPTDCLSSIFCSTPHHNTNRWITFLAPELCTNISWLREQERMKNVNTWALQAIDWFSRSHTVPLVGIHCLLALHVAALTLLLISASVLLSAALKLQIMITVITVASIIQVGEKHLGIWAKQMTHNSIKIKNMHSFATHLDELHD